MELCPCGSQTKYTQCCGPYLEQQHIPQTPEQLMRSRYTAFSVGKVSYIKQTMRGRALIGFDETAIKTWLATIKWTGLQVMQSYFETPEIGFVEFTATYLEQGKLKSVYEISEFHCINKVWFYVAGTLKPQKKIHVPLNSPCPCGNGKKYKNCHGKSLNE